MGLGKILQLNGVNAFCAVIVAKCASLLADVDSAIAFWSSVFALFYVFCLAVSSAIDVVRKLRGRNHSKGRRGKNGKGSKNFENRKKGT